MPLLPNNWLRPEWDAPVSVQALCTSRQGGVSRMPFDSCNLGLYVADDPSHVQHNRALLAQAMGAQPVFLHQVHGTQTLEIQPDSLDEQQADAAFTRHKGLACIAMVADCLPVLLCNAQGTQVAAAHAGWRGLLGHAGQGVLKSACQSFVPAICADPAAWNAQHLVAWLGPCIGPSAFEVGSEVRQAFVAQNPQSHVHFVPSAQDPNKWLANLPALARQRLHALGLKRIFGNDGSMPWCTVRNPSAYFSHRRDRVTGRFAAAVWLQP